MSISYTVSIITTIFCWCYCYCCVVYIGLLLWWICEVSFLVDFTTIRINNRIICHGFRLYMFRTLERPVRWNRRSKTYPVSERSLTYTNTFDVVSGCPANNGGSSEVSRGVCSVYSSLPLWQHAHFQPLPVHIKLHCHTTNNAISGIKRWSNKAFSGKERQGPRSGRSSDEDNQGSGVEHPLVTSVWDLCKRSTLKCKHGNRLSTKLNYWFGPLQHRNQPAFMPNASMASYFYDMLNSHIYYSENRKLRITKHMHHI